MKNETSSWPRGRILLFGRHRLKEKFEKGELKQASTDLYNNNM